MSVSRRGSGPDATTPELWRLAIVGSCSADQPSRSGDSTELQDVLRDSLPQAFAPGGSSDALLCRQSYGDVPQPMQAGLEGWAVALGRTSRSIRLPDSVRLAVRIAVHDRRDARQASAILDRVESRISATGGYDVVLACLDTAPLGLASLVTRAHPRPILLSLSALGRELRGRRTLAVASPAARTLQGPAVAPGSLPRGRSRAHPARGVRQRRVARRSGCGRPVGDGHLHHVIWGALRGSTRGRHAAALAGPPAVGRSPESGEGSSHLSSRARAAARSPAVPFDRDHGARRRSLPDEHRSPRSCARA